MGLLDALYTDCQGYLDVRAIQKGKDTRQAFYLLDDARGITSFIKQHRGWNLFFGVATRDGAAGKKANIVSIPAVWVDVDFKHVDETVVGPLIAALPFQPTCKVQSGGGLHLYWKLREPSGPEDIPRIESLNRALTMQLQGDMIACEAARILRIPNTHNYKYVPPREVLLVYQNGSSYNLCDLEEMYPYLGEDSAIARGTGLNTAEIWGGIEEGKRDESIFRYACQLRTRNLDRSEALAIILSVAALCKPPFPKKDAKRKLEQAWKYAPGKSDEGTTGDNDLQWGEMGKSGDTGGTNGGQMGDKSGTVMGDNSEKGGTNSAEPHETIGLAQLVESYIKNFHGNFKTREITDYLQSHYGLDKLPRAFHKALAKILTRHVEGGRLERTVRGGYRIVDTNLEDLDMGLGDSEHPVKLPLRLNELVYVEPKEIILVCGNTDAGKTCFALQCGLLNHIHIQEREEQYACQGAGGYDIFHFISEMGGVSFRNKFTPLGNGAYELYRQHVRVVKFKADSIADQIQAHSINIIDYLEPAGGDFREIVPTINSIFDKLISGVAIICVQMRSEHPVGGLGVFWRPRLAVGLLNDRDRNCKVAKIFKAKNIRGSSGVDEWEMDFWCQNKGTEFRELTEWRSPFQLKRTTYPVY